MVTTGRTNESSALPTWATLDARVSGDANEKLTMLASRLESFLEHSVLTVAPTAGVTFEDPFDGALGCGQGTSTMSRRVVISGLSEAELRGLNAQLVQLWRGFGYSIHHDEQTRVDDDNFLTVKHFHIEVSSTPSRPLDLGGSTPCVADDAAP